MDETVELRREHHVDERDCQQDGEDEIVRCPSKIARPSSEHEYITGLHVQLSHFFANSRNGIAEHQTVKAGLQRDLPLAVVALDVARSVIEFQLRDVAQTDRALVEISAAAGGASWNKQVTQARGIVAERFVKAEKDFILIVALFELRIQHLPADKSSDVGRQSVDPHTKISGSDAIHNHPQFLLSGLEVGSHVNNSGNSLDPGFQVHEILLQLFDLRPLKQHLQAVSGLLISASAVPTAASLRRFRKIGTTRELYSLYAVMKSLEYGSNPSHHRLLTDLTAVLCGPAA